MNWANGSIGEPERAQARRRRRREPIVDFSAPRHSPPCRVYAGNARRCGVSLGILPLSHQGQI